MEPLPLAAIIGSAIFFGSQFVPRKFSGAHDLAYCAAMTLGILLNALLWIVILLITRQELSCSWQALELSFASGMVWVAGNILLIYAVTRIGLARPFVILNLTSVVSFLGGIIFLQEFAPKQIYSLLLSFAAMIVIIAGCILITKTISKEQALVRAPKLSLIAAFLASIFFGTFNILIVYSTNILKLHLNLVALSLACGAALGGFGILLASRKFGYYLKAGLKSHGLATTSGLIWGLGNITCLYALTQLGLAIGIPILMGLITFVSACWGIAVFKELSWSKEPRNFAKFILGALATFAGIILISV